MSFVVERRPLRVEGSISRLSFEMTGVGDWPVWNRWLLIDGKQAYALGNICDTCEFWFERKEGAHGSLTPNQLSERLAGGIGGLDNALVSDVSEHMPTGSYEVLLLKSTARSVRLGASEDYFTNEQIKSWGLDPFWGLPHWPKVPYYRGDSYFIPGDALLFEFLVPMIPRTQLDPVRIETCESALESGSIPTALALSVLDIKARWTSDQYGDGVPHWCLAHYLIDGHHKVEASALAGRPIGILCFLSLSEGISTEAEISAAIGYLNSADRVPIEGA